MAKVFVCTQEQAQGGNSLEVHLGPRPLKEVTCEPFPADVRSHLRCPISPPMIDAIVFSNAVTVTEAHLLDSTGGGIRFKTPTCHLRRLHHQYQDSPPACKQSLYTFVHPNTFTMGISYSTAKYLAPVSFLYDFAAQQYGVSESIPHGSSQHHDTSNIPCMPYLADDSIDALPP